MDHGWCPDGCRVGPVSAAVAPCRGRITRQPSIRRARLAYTVWLLADFLDFVADESGATAKLTDSLFAKLLVEDTDDERRS